MENVRIYEILACKMVASQCGMFGDGKLESFNDWFSAFPRPIFPKDFMFFDQSQGGFIWYYIYSDGMHIPDEFKIIDFPGGLYAVASEVDGQDSSEVIKEIKNFIEEKGCFEEDTTRTYLGNIPTPPSASKAMGYEQMDYYVPIKIKQNKSL
jgi:hypothetical protein